MGITCGKCWGPSEVQVVDDIKASDLHYDRTRIDAPFSTAGGEDAVAPESVAMQEPQMQIKDVEAGVGAGVDAGVVEDHEKHADQAPDLRKGASILKKAKLVSLDLRVMFSQECDFVDPKLRTKNRQCLEQRALHGEASRKVISVPHTASDYLDSSSPKGLQLAQGIIARAKGMAADTAEEPDDMTHDSWRGPNDKDALPQLIGTDKLDKILDRLQTLNQKILVRLKEDPILMRVPAPAQVFGDLHGQFRDLLLFLHYYGFPSMESPCFIFNGDWVDRGHHQIETITLVFALKLAFPEKVFLVRGNHEDCSVNTHMGPAGFDHALNHRFKTKGPALFKTFGKTFEWLPCAALIADRILVVHGGIGEGNWTFGELEEVKRPITHEAMEQNRLVYNILWSDPIDDDRGDCFGVHDSPRDHHAGLLHTFSKAITEEFCRSNDIAMVIRSHEFEQRGAGYEIMHGGTLVTVFTARDYEHMHNDGAILSIEEYAEDGSQMLVVRPQQIWSHKKKRHTEMAH